MKKRQDGFTLIELLITLLCCSVITLAAMTFLLTYARVENRTESAISRQQTARIVLSAVENLAGSGKVKSVETVGDDWILLGEGNTLLLQYTASDGALISGGSTVLMGGLESAQAKLDQTTNLLTFSLKTSEGSSYTTSAYCRLGGEQTAIADKEDVNELLEDTKDALNQPGSETPASPAGRIALLSTLATQYGSTGAILSDGVYTDMYYSQWYCNGTFWDGWDKNTPWCACFLSWGAWRIDQADSTLLETVPKFADVDDGAAKFKTGTFGSWNDHDNGNGSYTTPVPGDFIFFNWDGDADADHVGAVFYVDSDRGIVYTIEGNSGGRVALCVYSLNDPRILGYGVLNWNR